MVDRQAGPGLETSFANAGEVSPGYASPWAGPGVPIKAIKWLLMKHGPLVVRPKLDPVMWLWLVKMLRNCTSARYAVNKSRMIPLAEYSRDCLRALRSGDRHPLRRAQPGHAAAVPHPGAARRHGRRYRGAEAVWRAVRGARPRRLHRGGAGAGRGEAQDSSVACGCRRTRPATATCSPRRSLCTPKSSACSSSSVRRSKRLIADGSRITGVATSAGVLRADAYVMALGSWSPRLLRPLGISHSGLSGQGLLDHGADRRSRTPRRCRR